MPARIIGAGVGVNVAVGRGVAAGLQAANTAARNIISALVDFVSVDKLCMINLPPAFENSDRHSSGRPTMELGVMRRFVTVVHEAANSGCAAFLVWGECINAISNTEERSCHSAAKTRCPDTIKGAQIKQMMAQYLSLYHRYNDHEVGVVDGRWDKYMLEGAVTGLVDVFDTPFPRTGVRKSSAESWVRIGP